MPVVDPVRQVLRGFSPTTAFQRRFRVDATVLLCGVPLLARKNVGGGFASVELDATPAAGAVAVALQFAAGSDPGHAHGLNRFGMLREAIVESQGSPREVAFAGLITRSREESIEQARNALKSESSAPEAIIARGRTLGGAMMTWIDAIELAPRCSWTDLPRSLGEAVSREPRSLPHQIESEGCLPFLGAMRRTALTGEASAECRFVHAGKSFLLKTRRNSQRPCELTGVIHNSRGAKSAEFKTVYAPGDTSGIPISIEYRPRSYLRLVFEATPAATDPPIPSLFAKESA